MKKWHLLKTKNIFYSMLLFYAMDPKVTVGIVLTEKGVQRPLLSGSLDLKRS